MTDLVTFDFEGSAVRVIDRDGEPWFVGKDVCASMGIVGYRRALSALDEDERDDVRIPDAIGREQATTVVNEPGCFQLAFTSRTEEAKRFKRWLAHDVLPTLRRTGRYAMPGAEAPAADNDDERFLDRPWRDVERGLQVMREYRMAANNKRLRQMWDRLGLPQPGDLPPGLADDTASEGAVANGRACLAHLLDAVVDIEGRTYRDAVIEAWSSRAMRDRLMPAGICVAPTPALADFMLVANRHENLEGVFAGTCWAAGEWRAALLALPECRPYAGGKRFGKGNHPVRSVLVPRELVGIPALH